MTYVLEAKKNVETAIEEMLNKSRSDALIAQGMDVIAQELIVALHNAIRALQYEDISSQNIRHMMETIGILDNFYKSINQDGLALKSIKKLITNELNTLNKNIELQNNNPVSAKSIKSGTVDLF
jgi:methyl-accepting chemotaxis protein